VSIGRVCGVEGWGGVCGRCECLADGSRRSGRL
jgi:hypothetical protein